MNKRLGEITGSSFDSVDLNYKGARMRAFDEIPTIVIDEKEKKFECLRDFNLYDDIEEDNNIKYYNPIDSTSCAKLDKLNNNLNNNYINLFTERLYSNFLRQYSQSFVISPVGLLSCVALLYRGSSNNTLIRSELGDKVNLFNKLYETLQIKQNIWNLCFISDNYDLNDMYTSYANNLGKIISIKSINHANGIIKKLKYFTDLYRFLEGITLVSLSRFNVVLKYEFTKMNNKLVQHNGTHYYYVDEDIECLEMELVDHRLRFGICKGPFTFDVIDYLKETTFKTIILPTIVMKSKFGLIQLFKQLGVTFEKVDYSEILTHSTQSCDLNDIIGECLFSFTGKGNNKIVSKSKSNLIFNCNGSFTYYIRCVKYNTLLCIGQKN